MPGKRETDLKILGRRDAIARIKLRNPGASSKELSKMYEEMTGLSIPARTVRYDLGEIRKQWVEDTKANFDQLQAQELIRIDMLEQAAWDAWRASMKPYTKRVIERLREGILSGELKSAVKKMAEELGDDNVDSDVVEDIVRSLLDDYVDAETGTFINKITETFEESPGDPRFLSQIHAIQQERRKVLGVYAPELHSVNVHSKIEVKGYRGGWSPDSWGTDENPNITIVDGEHSPALPAGEQEESDS